MSIQTTRLIRGSKAAGRIEALRPVVERAIARGELRPDTDAGLLLETLIAPLHGRLLLTGEPVDEQLGERIVDLVLQGACQSRSSAYFDNQRVPSQY